LIPFTFGLYPRIAAQISFSRYNSTHSRNTNSFLLLRQPPKQSTMFSNFSTLWKTIKEPVQDNGKEMRVIAGPTTKSSRRLHASPYPSRPARLIPGENDPLGGNRREVLSKVSINDQPSAMTYSQFLQIPKPMEFGIATNTSIPNPVMPRAGPLENPMELDNATAGPVSESLPFTAGLPENLMELDNATTGPGPPIATAGPVSELLPFTTGLPENLMELDNATTGPVTESLKFNTGPPVEPNAVPEIPIISLQEPAVNTDLLLNSTNMDHETTIPLPSVRPEGQPNMFCFGKTQSGTRRKLDGDRRLRRQETDTDVS